MALSVAVLEDDVQLRSTLVRGLAEEGFSVCLAAGTGAALLDGFEAAAPDVAIIDIGLPDADGRDVAMALRARGQQTPLLMLTARTQLVDRLSGFHAGADDYLPKPFAFEELVVRLRALTKRAGLPDQTDAANPVLDPLTHRVLQAGRSVDVTPTEFRLLATLIARPNEAVRRGALVAAAWPDGAIVHDNTLDAYMARLRRKLRAVSARDVIATVRGVGYRWEPCAEDS